MAKKNTVTSNLPEDVKSIRVEAQEWDYGGYVAHVEGYRGFGEYFDLDRDTAIRVAIESMRAQEKMLRKWDEEEKASVA